MQTVGPPRSRDLSEWATTDEALIHMNSGWRSRLADPAVEFGAGEAGTERLDLDPGPCQLGSESLAEDFK